MLGASDFCCRSCAHACNSIPARRTTFVRATSPSEPALPAHFCAACLYCEPGSARCCRVLPLIGVRVAVVGGAQLPMRVGHFLYLQEVCMLRGAAAGDRQRCCRARPTRTGRRCRSTSGRRWPRPASPRGRWARRRATRPAAILPCVRSCARSRAAGAKSARLWRVRCHDVCFAWRSQSAHGRSSLYGESASVLRVCGCDLKVRVVELFCATHIFRFYTTQACRACAQKSSGMVFHARRVAAML